jgi:hypothetical protein
MTPQQADRLSSLELGLELAIDDYLLRVVDPKTGVPLPTGEEYQEQLKLARREARKAKRQAAEARRRAAETERRAAETERRAAEIQRQEAQAQLKAAEAQNEVETERRRSAALEAEIVRLRALLPPEEQS